MVINAINDDLFYCILESSSCIKTEPLSPECKLTKSQIVKQLSNSEGETEHVKIFELANDSDDADGSLEAEISVPLAVSSSPITMVSPRKSPIVESPERRQCARKVTRKSTRLTEKPTLIDEEKIENVEDSAEPELSKTVEPNEIVTGKSLESVATQFPYNSLAHSSRCKLYYLVCGSDLANHQSVWSLILCR